ncbi:hypothetical protein LOK49_LG10G00974 [Camellia lanceoleosa]|uniref:Uncharacterized protein n=1 Tax=Camellia lanceoleosa TaxID=1840588 RepID=A0ACC0GAJ0_9ERIC|nr:hypothetical protein LOK49_LG10G00974 [Camellia lanceoleosa]
MTTRSTTLIASTSFSATRTITTMRESFYETRRTRRGGGRAERDSSTWRLHTRKLKRDVAWWGKDREGGRRVGFKGWRVVEGSSSRGFWKQVMEEKRRRQELRKRRETGLGKGKGLGLGLGLGLGFGF